MLYTHRIDIFINRTLGVPEYFVRPWYDKSPEIMEFRTGQLLFIIKCCLACCHLWHHTIIDISEQPVTFSRSIWKKCSCSFTYVKTRVVSNLKKIDSKGIFFMYIFKDFCEKTSFFPSTLKMWRYCCIQYWIVVDSITNTVETISKRVKGLKIPCNLCQKNYIVGGSFENTLYFMTDDLG